MEKVETSLYYQIEMSSDGNIIELDILCHRRVIPIGDSSLPEYFYFCRYEHKIVELSDVYPPFPPRTLNCSHLLHIGSELGVADVVAKELLLEGREPQWCEKTAWLLEEIFIGIVLTEIAVCLDISANLEDGILTITIFCCGFGERQGGVNDYYVGPHIEYYLQMPDSWSFNFHKVVDGRGGFEKALRIVLNDANATEEEIPSMIEQYWQDVTQHYAL